MYATHRQTTIGAQKWQNLAIKYQTKAYDLTKGCSDPADYPNEVFYCYRGYASCMQMCDACWAHIDATNDAYFRRLDYEQSKRELVKAEADYYAERDRHFISMMCYIAAILLGILFADVWVSFIEWLAPLLI